MSERSMRVSNEFVEIMHKGDNRCKIPLGARVRKITQEPGDVHQIGEEGEVTGSVYHDELKLSGYLVYFDNNPIETFITELKITMIQDKHDITR